MEDVVEDGLSVVMVSTGGNYSTQISGAAAEKRTSVLAILLISVVLRTMDG